MDHSEIIEEIKTAYDQIRALIVKTPLIKFENESNNNMVYLKLENSQHTGSFKLRGALNKILSLTENQKSKGVITASTGNHALATAYALKLTNGKGTIYLPNEVVKAKLDKLKEYDVSLVHFGDDSADTEGEARRISELEDLPFISPYNDYKIIAGQGTIGIEILEDVKQVDHVFVTVGGGGLISGIASYLKGVNPNIKIYGCQPINSAIMYHSLNEGKIIELESKPTLSDGSAGGIEMTSVTFELVQKFVDEFVLVTEDQIKTALVDLYKNNELIVEGAAAVALAAYQKISSSIDGTSVIIICGGNIDPDLFDSIVQ
ncbi:MAG: threonine/serine dehydratase [Candidatus Heimdallarchaeota archaeon]|nr:threonine/serine dehydratase [Candidatus Heimdallarchaeota archaeon]